MKIQHIKITNITSLRGEHQLPLEEFIGNDGLFAITGPTGAGKSSLLTAITLALYGTGHKTKLSATDYVSTGEDFAEVELLFEFKKSSYMAYWAIKTIGTRGKILTKPLLVRKLFKEGIPVEMTPEKLLGLSFEQFTRTVILNQGEFAKFLTSNFTDRKKILENLYEGEGLSEISKILKNEIKEKESELSHLQSLMQAILPMDESEAIHKKEQLYRNQEEYHQYKATFNQLQDCLKQLKGMLNLYSDEQKIQLKKTEKKHRLIEEERIFFEAEILKQKKTLELNQLQAKRLEKRILFEQASRSFDQLENLKSQEKKRLISIENNNNSLNQLNSKKAEIEIKTQQYRSNFEKDLKELEAIGFKNLQKSTIASHALHQNLTRWQQLDDSQKNTQSRLTENSKELHSIEKEAQEIKKKIDALINEINNKSSDDLSLEQKRTQEEINEFIFLKSHATKALEILDISKKEFGLVEDEIIQYNSQLQALVQQHADCNKTITQQEFNFWKNKIYHHFYQESLKEGQCILCQSHLPIVSRPDDINAPEQDSLQLKLKDLDTKILDLKMSLQLLNQKKKDLSQKTDDQTKILQDFRRKYDLETSTFLWAEYQSKFEAKLSTIHSEINDKDKKQQLILTYQEQIQRERSKYALKKESVMKMQKDSDSIKITLNQLNEEITHFFQIDKAENSPFGTQSIDRCLACVVNALELNPLEQSLTYIDDSIQKERAQIKQHHADAKEAQEQKLKAQTEWNNSQTELRTTFQEYVLDEQFPSSPEQIQKRLDQWVIQREQELAHIENDYIEKKKSKESSEQLLIQLSEQYKAIEQALANHRSILGELLHFDFKALPLNITSSFEKLKCSLIDEDLIPSLNVRDVVQRFYEDQLSPFVESLEMDIKKRLESINNDQALINLYELKQAEKLKYANESLILQNLLKVKKDLALVLGKDEFRSFALGLIEARLLSLTNIELKKLCDGRYHLRPTKTHFGQDFLIIDYFQYGHERKIETLSGGETFLVSLAMALSLAEMSRGSTEINCFFIDEGFGSLDQDSLDDVLDVLHNIRTRGKQLGIISHIRELTQRIPMVIRLQKNANGHSEILLSHH